MECISQLQEDDCFVQAQAQTCRRWSAGAGVPRRKVLFLAPVLVIFWFLVWLGCGNSRKPESANYSPVLQLGLLCEHEVVAEGSRQGHSLLYGQCRQVCVQLLVQEGRCCLSCTR